MEMKSLSLITPANEMPNYAISEIPYTFTIYLIALNSFRYKIGRSQNYFQHNPWLPHVITQSLH